MKEVALKFGANRSLIGILSEGEPVDVGQNIGTGTLLLNAGLIHHIGPNRIYVKLARRMAKMGITGLRFDFSGIGDSGPRRDKIPADASILDEARQAVDLLAHRCGVKKFICVGLCAGAAAAARISLVDPRVNRVILVNPFLPRTPQTDLMRQSRYYYAHAMFSPRSWLKFIMLKSGYGKIWDAVILKIKDKLQPNSLRDSELTKIVEKLKYFFYQVNNRKIRLLLVFSEGEIGDEYLRRVAGHEYNALKQSGMMHIETLIGSDHLITPLSSQNHLIESITDWLNQAT